MKIDANPELIIDNLTSQIAKLSKENAFYLAALTESHAKVEELEKEQKE